MNKAFGVVGSSFLATFYAARYGFLGRDSLTLRDTKEDYHFVPSLPYSPFVHKVEVEVEKTLDRSYQSYAWPNTRIPTTSWQYYSFRPIDYKIVRYEKQAELTAQLNDYKQPFIQGERYSEADRAQVKAGLAKLIEDFDQNPQ